MERNHTGIEVDRETCVVCGACSAACPTEALIVEGLTLVVIPERCRPCGQAALVCPTGALRCPGGAKP
jgi:NAD-dependent dihydropyrimidine dehydrogenase PreA subunit